MATELQYNNEQGFLGANLAPSTPGTSQAITNLFQVAPNFATITGSQFIKLALDAGASNYEIVYLTAYTAGSKNGTITRAAEDSTNWGAGTHTSGTSSWQCVPTVSDFTTLATAITTETTRAQAAEATNAANILLRLLASNNLSDLANKATALATLIAGSPSNGQLLQWNGSAWVPVTIAALPPNGAASGDLGGTYPGPSVARVQGTAVSNATPTLGQVLQFNGTSWVPTSLLPTGVMIDWTGPVASVPAGWVAANGQSLSTGGANAALFALYAYTFGGSGSSFNVPDLRGRTRIGYIDATQFGYANVTPGGTMGSSTISSGNLPSLAHTHSFSSNVNFTSPALQAVVSVSSSTLFLPTSGAQPVSPSTLLSVSGTTSSALGGSATAYSPPAFAVVPIIKL